MNNKLLWQGSLGFCFISLIVFGTVAFAEGWMYQNLGYWGAYGVWTAIFIFGGAIVLSPIVVAKIHTWKFCLIFFIAFFSYSCAWIASYYFFRNAMGEWLGSFCGCLCLAIIFIQIAKNKNISYFVEVFIVLFFSNSVGYFLGRDIFNALGSPIGMILWGLVYGLGLGFGLSYVLNRVKEY